MMIFSEMYVSHSFFLALLVVFLPLFSIADSQETAQPEAVLEQLASFDSVYKAGFFANGTRVNVPVRSSDLPPAQVQWRISIDGNRLAYREDILRTLEWKDLYKDPAKIPPKTGSANATSYRTTLYFGDDLSGMYCENGIPEPTFVEEWKKGTRKAILGRTLSLEKADAQAYTLFHSTALWSLGRGFSADITQVEEVRKVEGGLLFVRANALPAGAQRRSWELIIDPNQMYMVRSAKRYRNGELQLELTNSGEHWFGQVLCPAQMQIIDYRSGTPITTAFTVDEAAFTPDSGFIQAAFTQTHPPYDAGLNVIDFRKEMETADPAAPYKRITPEEARMLDTFGLMPDWSSLTENILDVPAGPPKADVAEAVAPMTKTVPPLSSNPHITLPSVLALFALVFLIGGGYALYRGRRKDDSR